MTSLFSIKLLIILLIIFVFPISSADISVTLLSMTPSEIYQNCSENIVICYGISHDIPLNGSSVSFIFRNYDYDLSDSNHSIRPPINDLAVVWNFNGKILRAANRNETLNFENNDTITGGDIYSWSGLDENNSELSIVYVNSTYTQVYINTTVHQLMPQMHFIDRSELQGAPKTRIAIHKHQSVLVKFWNYEIFKGNTDFLGVGYTDTNLNSNSNLWPIDTNPIKYYYISSGYNPATGGDPLASGYAVYMGALNAPEWINHVYNPHMNSSYVRGFINNALLHTYINTSNISYVLYTSNTPESKPFYINMTNVVTSSNVSFADTRVLWAGGSLQSYTPNIWFAFVKTNISFDHKLYAADNNDNWANSTMSRTDILSSMFPPTNPSFYAFHNGFQDFNMNGIYHDIIQLQISASSDPDGGTVVHNITLHYDVNKTYVALINSSAVAEDGIYTNVSFNTTPYYSQTEYYTIKIVATDDEGKCVSVWSVPFKLSEILPIYGYVSFDEGIYTTYLSDVNVCINESCVITDINGYYITDSLYLLNNNYTITLGDKYGFYDKNKVVFHNDTVQELSMDINSMEPLISQKVSFGILPYLGLLFLLIFIRRIKK